MYKNIILLVFDVSILIKFTHVWMTDEGNSSLFSDSTNKLFVEIREV